MIKSYKCPSCGGALVYNAGTDTLICPNCNQTIDVKAWEAKELSGQPIGLTGKEDAADNAGNGVKEFKCAVCGATLVTDEYSSALSCAYCSSPTLIESRLTGEFKPKYVLPFKFDKKGAQEYFKNWKGKGRFTPSSFKSNATMDKVTGIYVPYWLYSYTVDTDMVAEGAHIEVERDGDTETTTKTIYTITKNAHVLYDKVPVNASEKVDDEAMHIMEPYDYSELREFSMPYLSGFVSEKYNQPSEAFVDGVKSALKTDAVSAVRDTIDEYEEVSVLSSDVNFKNEVRDYALLPLWSLNFMYAGKSYPLYMNGQTGKIYGTLPTSKAKIAAYTGAAFVICFLIAFILGGVL